MEDRNQRDEYRLGDSMHFSLSIFLTPLTAHSLSLNPVVRFELIQGKSRWHLDEELSSWAVGLPVHDGLSLCSASEGWESAGGQSVGGLHSG